MGRQREFDVEKALDAALCVFWRKGYEGASYTDLTQAIGVERPALYSAFGNKEALFRLALARYYEHYMDFIPVALELPTSREVVEHLLRRSVELNTRYLDRRGCMGIQGALAGTDDSEPIRLALIEARAEGETALRERLERSKAEGDLPPTANCAVLATYLLAVLHGMAVQAKAGFSREVLELVVDQVMSTWPGPAESSVKAPESAPTSEPGSDSAETTS
ncbi:TetR/AcrR family transcriptional regulator [Pseudomonas sp. SZMC_28357]|uniref:TetR/AcrR family transcriptional regulator n=1 Tax=Pseudomonas sp. SZMC_28357 TaxID=3074380 RepID=UPI002870EE89|nr:TetR/AcrR family transcriptional regulator [Pseudomonas sp. SZMC_28357]MDR9753752.1 TetR/AcrR family transcriptional regulator [Pseudomonas sp. SZMC_28357]